MKTVIRIRKKAMAVLLAAAIAATSLPQTGSLVYAAEQGENNADDNATAEERSKEENIETDTAAEAGDESFSDNEDENPVDGSGEGADTAEGDSAENGSTEDGSKEDSVPDEDIYPEETTTEETDWADSDIEDDEIAVHENNAINTTSTNGTDASEPVDKDIVTVTIAMPAYNGESCISEFWYATDEEELIKYDSLTEDTPSIEIDVPLNGSLRFKPVLKDKYWMTSVTDYNQTFDANKEGIYILSNVTGNVSVNMSVELVYAITFVTEHAKVMHIKSWDDNAQPVFEEVTDTLKMNRAGIENFGFMIEAEEGYELDNFSSTSINSEGIRVFRKNFYYDKETNERIRYYSFYINDKAYIRDETKIYVTAAEPHSQEEYQLSFTCPADAGMSLSVKADGEPLGLNENNAVTVNEEQVISFSVDVDLQTVYKDIRAAYTDDIGNTSALPYEYSQTDTDDDGEYDAAHYEYLLGKLNDGDISVNISFVDVDLYTVIFESKEDISLDVLQFREQLYFTDVEPDETGCKRISISVPADKDLIFIGRHSYERGDITVSATGIGELTERYPYAKLGEDECDAYYKVTPTDNMVITFAVNPCEYIFDYMEEDVEVLVYDAANPDTPLALSENKSIRYYEDKRLLIKVKPAEGKQMTVSVEWYYDYSELLELGEIDADGYYSFNVNTYDDDYGHKLKIRCYDTCTVTFVTDGDVDSVERVVRYSHEEDEENWKADWGYANPITVYKDQYFYFRVRYDSFENKLDYVSTTGTIDGSLEPYAYDDGAVIYRLNPSEDTIITVKTSKREEYTVCFDVDARIKSWNLECESISLDNTSYLDNSSYSIKENENVVIHSIGSDSPENYMGKVTYTVEGGKPQEADVYYSEDWGGVYYSFKITGNTTVSIDAVPIEQYTVSFENGDKLESITVWELGTEADREAYPVVNNKITLNNNKYYCFNITPRDGYALESIKAFSGTTGRETILQKLFDDNGVNYYKLCDGYGMSEDLTITTNLTEAYSLCFDSQTTEVYSLLERQSYGDGEWEPLDITSIKRRVPVTDSYSFYLDDLGFDVTADSDLFTITKAWHLSYDEEDDYYYRDYYIYTITPKQGVALPPMVTVSVVEADVTDTHEITIDYPDTVRVMNLGRYVDDEFRKFPMVGNKVKVSGSSTVLRVGSVTGYTAIVTMQRSSDTEPIVLPAYRYSDILEYYLGEVTEDAIIRISTERRTDKQKYCEVYFYGDAIIKDTVYQTPYDSTSECYYIPRGESISFFAEPYYDYEIQSISANRKELTPVWDASLGKNVYTVTPATYTDISVVTSKLTKPDNPVDPDIPDDPDDPDNPDDPDKPDDPVISHTVTFTYPDTVGAVIIKDYTLEDNKITVPDGREISFKIELADENYEVTSVKANEQEAAYDAESGYYTIPSCTADMEIVITTDLKQTEEPELTWALKESSTGNEVTGQDDIYWIDADTKYSVEVSGAENGIALTSVSLLDGITRVAPAPELEAGNTRASFTIDKNYEGKVLKLRLYIEDDCVVAFTLRVRTTLTKISVAGVTAGRLEQSIDTRKEYPLTLTPENADYSVFNVDIAPAEGQQSTGITAFVSDGILTINTAGAANNDSAVIKLYNDRAAASGEIDYIDGGTFTVTAVSPKALENGMPNMTFKGADDISLVLTLQTPNGVEPTVNGRQYYKFEVTPLGDTVPETIRDAVAQPYYIEKTMEDTQDIELIVNRADYGKGCAWNFDVKVTLIQTKDAEALTKDNEAEKKAYASQTKTLSGLSTKNPSYETKLTLKKGTTTVYTTQTDVCAAAVTYSNNTSFAKIDKVEDITKLSDDNGALEVWENDGKIYATASGETQLGKHTIEIIAYGSETMYKTRANLTITVVKGIESLSVKVPTTQLYKMADKKASIKATPVYNENTTAPKTKKVTWDVVDTNGNPFHTWDVLYGKLSMKNGKVTVDKAFALSPDKEDNQFRIRAAAIDFAGNTVYGLSDVITISNTAMEIGSIYLLRKNETSESYTVVAKSSDSSSPKSFETNELSGAILAATLTDNNDKLMLGQSYTEREIRKYQIDVTQLTYKSSNKAVGITTNGVFADINITKPANNITFTLTAADGGKDKATMKFSVIYAKPMELRLDALDDNTQTSLEADATNANNKKFAGTTNSVIRLVVQQRAGEGENAIWNGLSSYTNYKVKVKGGKLLTSNIEDGIYTMVVTGEKATVTLSDKTEAGRAAKVYTITNTAYSAAKAFTLKTTYYNNSTSSAKSLTAGVLANRKVEFITDGQYKQVLIETDISAKIKAQDGYNMLEEAAKISGSSVFGQPISVTGSKVTVNFDNTFIPAGKYKLKLTFGETTSNGFMAASKPVSITLKVAVPKVTKGSFKPITSYKLNTGTTPQAEMKGTGKAYNKVAFTSLMNANIKGQENSFCEYFELNGNVLSLKKGITAEQIAELKSTKKDNLTGYVSYTAECGSDGYGNPYEIVTGTVKIKVTLK